MFTGIVQDILTIISANLVAGSRRIVLTLPKTERCQPGDSILLNGICSTVVAIESNELVVEYMAQTDRLTTSSLWRPGDKVNCEMPLTLQKKISGSLVTGHIDTIARVETPLGSLDDKQVTVRFDMALPATVLPQGSITIDGVNLTITSVAPPVQITVHIIPHTWQHTIIQYYQAGSRVNVEFDYVAKLLLARMTA